MKGLDEMDQALTTAQTPRSMLSKFVDMTMLLLACGGLGYCVGNLMAGGEFAVIEGVIMLVAIAIIFGLIQRRMKEFPAANRQFEARRHLQQLGVGAFIGIVGMGTVLLLLGDQLERLADQMLYWNLAGAFLAANKKMMNVKPGDEPLSDDEYADTRIMLLWAAIGLLTYGLILGIVVFSSSYEGAPNWLALAALIAALIGQLTCNFILWRRYDELYREVTRTACAVSYVIVEAIIILWAGLSMFGFQVRFDPMAVLVVVMSISLITTLTVSVRRGLN